MITPDSIPKVSEGIAFYIDRKNEQLLVAFDIFLVYPRCRIDTEAYSVILLCDGKHTVREIAEQIHQDEKEIIDLIEMLCNRQVVELEEGI